MSQVVFLQTRLLTSVMVGSVVDPMIRASNYFCVLPSNSIWNMNACMFVYNTDDTKCEGAVWLNKIGVNTAVNECMLFYLHVHLCVYQKDEVRSLVVEGDRRSAERSGRVVRALRGRMPESLTGQLGVIQLLLKVCTHTFTDTRAQHTQTEEKKKKYKYYISVNILQHQIRHT